VSRADFSELAPRGMDLLRLISEIIMRPIKTALIILCTAAVAVVTLSWNTWAQSSPKPPPLVSGRPYPVEPGQFICCHAMLVDCRTKVILALREIGGNALYYRCVTACLRKLKC
jgi:hypothetical protein